MDPKGWVRPVNYKSLDNRYGVEDLLQFENNWLLIESRLSERRANPSFQETTGDKAAGRP